MRSQRLEWPKRQCWAVIEPMMGRIQGRILYTRSRHMLAYSLFMRLAYWQAGQYNCNEAQMIKLIFFQLQHLCFKTFVAANGVVWRWLWNVLTAGGKDVAVDPWRSSASSLSQSHQPWKGHLIREHFHKMLSQLIRVSRRKKLHGALWRRKIAKIAAAAILSQYLRKIRCERSKLRWAGANHQIKCVPVGCHLLWFASHLHLFTDLHLSLILPHTLHTPIIVQVLSQW